MAHVQKTIRHFNDPGHAHFLTFSCYGRLPLLKAERTRQWFVDSVIQAKTRHRYALWAYVIMPDHAHLLVLPLDKKYDISSFLKSVKQSVARKAKHYLQANHRSQLQRLTVTHGEREIFRFWQSGPGYDRNIRSEDELFAKIKYIHNNPLKKGLVSDPTDWKWSSSRWYCGKGDVPLPIDEMRAPKFARTNKFVRGTVDVAG